jgi:hypothetical protein
MARRKSRRRKSSKGITGKIGGWISRIARRPVSHVIAPALLISGVLTLVAMPLSNGDGIFGRIQSAFNSKGTNIFAADNPTTGSGNNMFSILALQLQQNLPTATPQLIGAAIAAIVGRITKT